METKDGTKMSAKDLFRLIPDDLVERLSEEYSVDSHARAFSGLLFLKLLILGWLCSRMSSHRPICQNSMEQSFSGISTTCPSLRGRPTRA